LEFENQQPLNTLAGLLVRPGDAFTVTPAQTSVAEGASVTFTAQAGGAQKIFWSVLRDGHETRVAVARLKFTLDASRVTGDTPVTVRCRVVTANGVQTRDDLAELAVDELVDMTGMEEDAAKALIMKAREHWFQ